MSRPSMINDQPPIILERQCAQHITGEWSSGDTGFPVTYFINGRDDGELGIGGISPNNQTGVFWGSRNPQWALSAMGRISNFATNSILPTEGGDMDNTGWTKLWQTDYWQRIRIQNVVNFDVKLEGWLCECRYDQPCASNDQNKSNFWTPIDILRLGMQQNSINYTNFSNLSAIGLALPSLNPYNSKTFCENYKIKKHKQWVIKPGESIRVIESQNRWQKINLQRLFFPKATNTTYQSQTNNSERVMYCHMKGEQFWLFRIQTWQAGEIVNTATIASIPPQVHCITDIRYEYKVGPLPRQGPLYTHHTTLGIGDGESDPQVAIDVMNNELNEKQSEVQL